MKTTLKSRNKSNIWRIEHKTKCKHFYIPTTPTESKIFSFLKRKWFPLMSFTQNGNIRAREI